jgi:hypothetical protein
LWRTSPTATRAAAAHLAGTRELSSFVDDRKEKERELSTTNPDEGEDRVTHDELEQLFRVFADGPGGEGGAAVAVPAPHRPSPHDSAIALPLPVEDDRD